jgi:hypothetical protein
MPVGWTDGRQTDGEFENNEKNRDTLHIFMIETELHLPSWTRDATFGKKESSNVISSDERREGGQWPLERSRDVNIAGVVMMLLLFVLLCVLCVLCVSLFHLKAPEVVENWGVVFLPSVFYTEFSCIVYDYIQSTCLIINVLRPVRFFEGRVPYESPSLFLLVIVNPVACTTVCSILLFLPVIRPVLIVIRKRKRKPHFLLYVRISRALSLRKRRRSHFHSTYFRLLASDSYANQISLRMPYADWDSHA